MKNLYQITEEINECIGCSDTKKLSDALKRFNNSIASTSSDYSAGEGLYSYFMNKIFNDHTEFLDDPDLLELCKNYMTQERILGGCQMTDGYSRMYFNGKLLCLIMQNDKGALQLLKQMEKISFGEKEKVFFPLETRIDEYYNDIIEIAVKYKNTEILDYIAHFSVKITDESENTAQYKNLQKLDRLAGYSERKTDEEKFYSHTWFLICSLLENQIYDILDRLFKDVFNSDLVKLVKTYKADLNAGQSAVHYIRQLLQRYGKGVNASEENKVLCRLIDETHLTDSFLTDSFLMTQNNRGGYGKLINELSALAEINYKTRNITNLNFLAQAAERDLKFNPFAGTAADTNDNQKYEAFLEIIEKLVAPEAYCNLSGFVGTPPGTSNNVDFIKKCKAAIVIDNACAPLCGERNEFVNNGVIFSYKTMLPIIKNHRIIISDPVNENYYINRLIKLQSRLFAPLIQAIDPSEEEIMSLIPFCVERKNLTAVNELRKMLKEKASDGKGES